MIDLPPAELWLPPKPAIIRGAPAPKAMLPWAPIFGPRTLADGNDAFTKSLLHLNNATTDSNVGGSAKTWTLNGTAAFSTAQVKFGSHSLLLPGVATAFLSTPDHADFTFGSSNFTVDFWFYILAANATAIWACGNGLSNGGILVGRNGTDNMFFAVYDAAGSPIAQAISAITTQGTGWRHIACVRNGSNFILFIDGVQRATASSAAAVADSTTAFHIGRVAAFALNPWNGYIDEFRVSIGIARWTTGFTPPATPYTP